MFNDDDGYGNDDQIETDVTTAEVDETAESEVDEAEVDETAEAEVDEAEVDETDEDEVDDFNCFMTPIAVQPKNAMMPISQLPEFKFQEMERDRNLENSLNFQGCINLIGGIIRQQLVDYLYYLNNGVCKKGKVIVKEFGRLTEGRTIPEAHSCCLFLQDNGSILEWINIMGINITPQDIRRKFGLDW